MLCTDRRESKLLLFIMPLKFGSGWCWGRGSWWVGMYIISALYGETKSSKTHKILNESEKKNENKKEVDFDFIKLVSGSKKEKEIK